MEKTEQKLAEAFAEAKENHSKENVIVVPREEQNTESPTLEENKSSNAGLSDSRGEKHDPETRGDAPNVVATHQEAQAVPEALQNEMPNEVPPVENGYPPEAPLTPATKPSAAGSEQKGEPARMSLPGNGEQPLSADMNVPVGRNWELEWKELADAHPEVVGKELPEDIYKACLQGDKPPLRVYESMMLAKQAEEIETLKQQIATLRQNDESASRAPVSAVTGGGAGAEPEDPFVAAFRRFN